MALPPRDSVLPPALEHFLVDCIDSVEQIEILVLLVSEHERWWPAKDLAGELMFSQATTDRDLRTLARRGLLNIRLAAAAEYHLAPRTAALAQGVADLTRMYHDDRVGLLSHLVASKGRSLRHFAGAFTFRKDR